MIDLALVARRLADLLGGGATLALAWHGSIFVAAPKAVGITSTGEIGEGVANDLPSVLPPIASLKPGLPAARSRRSHQIFTRPTA